MSIRHGSMFGKHQTEEAKRKIGLANSGKHPSEETRLKMRAKKLGTHHSKEHNAKIGAARFLGDKAKLQSGRMRAQRMYPCPKGMERHHIDGNPLNNVPENIMFVTNKQHQELDGRLEKARLRAIRGLKPKSEDGHIE